MLTPALLNSFLTGIRYQVIHSILILVIALFPFLKINNKKQIALVLTLGILLFSGSIYLLTLGIVSAKYIWFVTPIGGLFFLLGWLLLGFYLIKQKEI